MKPSRLQKKNPTDSAQSAKKSATTVSAQSNRWVIFLAIVLSAGTILFFVKNSLVVSDLYQEIEALKKEQTKVMQENEFLRSEVIRLQSPARIIPFARKNLGLIQPAVPPTELTR